MGKRRMKPKRSSKAELKRFWTPANDKRLVRIVKERGQNWQEVAKLFNSPLITPYQAKLRYSNSLDKKIRRNRFTWPEDQAIIKVYREHGTKWERVQQLLPHRTINMIKNRFYGHIRKTYFMPNKGAPEDVLLQLSLLDQEKAGENPYTNSKLNALIDILDTQSCISGVARHGSKGSGAHTTAP